MISKKLLFIQIIISLGIKIYAQSIAWQATLGSSVDDNAISILNSPNGYLLGAGYSKASSNANNYIAFRLDNTGAYETGLPIGGSGEDIATCQVISADGRIFLGGYSNSTDLFPEIPATNGTDGWIVKLNTNLNPVPSTILKKRNIGGTGIEYIYSIAATSDNGCIAVGSSNFELLVAKLNDTLGITWMKNFGGTGVEAAYAVAADAAGNYIVGGLTSSTDGYPKVKQGNGIDAWIMKLNNNGDTIWSKTYGGTGIDGVRSITIDPAGGYLVAGTSTSADGDVKKNKGKNDLWVMKLDVDGKLIWSKTYGGSEDDIITCSAYYDNNNGITEKGVTVKKVILH